MKSITKKVFLSDENLKVMKDGLLPLDYTIYENSVLRNPVMISFQEIKKQNRSQKAGEDVQYFQVGEDVPEGSKVISVQLQNRSGDGLKEVVGYWYQVPVKNSLTKALKYLSYAVQKADIDDGGAWKERVLDFLRDNNQ